MLRKIFLVLLFVFAVQLAAFPGLFGSEESFAAAPGVIYEEKFETYTVGNVQAPWSNGSTVSALSKVTIANDPGDSSRGKVLRIEHLGTTPPPTGTAPLIQAMANLATSSYADQSGIFITEYDFYMDTASQTTGNVMMYSREVSWPYPVGVSATNGGNVAPVVAPTGSGTDINRAAVIGQWHRAKIETDVPNQKYRFSVDGSSNSDWILFRPSTAVPPVPPVLHAKIYKTSIGSGNAAGAGVFYIDNLIMYNPALYVTPTPSPSPTPFSTQAPVLVPTPAPPAGYTVYEPLNLPLQLADTVYSGSLGSDTGMFVRKQDAFNTYIEVNTNATSKNLLTIPFSSSNDITTVSFDYKPASTTSPFYFNVKGSAGGTGPEVNIISLPLEATTIKGYSLGSITDFNTVQIRISKSLSVYDMYIGGVKCNASPLPYTNAAAAATLKGIVVSTPAGSGAFRGSFDNFMVYAGEPLDVAKKGVTLSSVASGLLASSSSVTLTTTAANTTGKALTAALIAIVRNGTKVEDIKIMRSVNVVSGISNLSSISLNMPTHKGRYSISVMLWDNSFSSPIPLAQTKVAANPYSAVFLSNRWYRTNPGDYGGDINSLDAIKRFMATGDKWSYITNNTQIQNITALGVSFQGSLNTINQVTDGWALSLEGTKIVAPWMTWTPPSYWGCLSRPAYYNAALAIAKTTIDAGATEFQHDDAAGNYGMIGWAPGCFCPDCITGFRNYLKSNLTSAQITELGITDIDTFDYKQFILVKGITTNNDYTSQRTTTLGATNTWFKKFQMYTSEQYYANLRSAMNAYAGRNITLSVNMNAMSVNDIILTDQYMGQSFDYGITEHNEGAHSLTNIVTGGSIRTSIGTPIIISPVVTQRTKELVRPAIAQAYAMGQYMLVPWDIWLPGTDVPRYFGTIEEYGDIYQFIRENATLFDGREIPAKVGVLVNWADITVTNTGAIKDFVMNLFNAGVPFKLLMANYNSDYPLYTIQKEQLGGLDYVLTYSDINSFSAEDKAAVQGCGATLVDKGSVNSTFISARDAATVLGASDVYSVVRRAQNGDTSLHIISNDGYSKPENLSVSISSAFVPENPEAWLYRPGKTPQKLTLGFASGKYSASIDSMAEWAIISFTKRAQNERGSFILPKEYSAFNVGNPAPTGSAMMEGGRILMKSTGKGMNTYTQNDSGKQDSLTYAYKYIDSPMLRDYSVSAAVERLEGPLGTGGGVMVREGPATNAIFAALRKRTDGKLFLEYRATTNVSTTSVDLGYTTNPYLKIAKVGSAIYAYTSANGITWTSVGQSVSIVFGQATVGSFVFSGDSANAATAVILGLTVTQQAKQLSLDRIGTVSFNPSTPLTLKINQVMSMTVMAVIDGKNTVITPDMYTLSSGNTAVMQLPSASSIKGIAQGDTTLTVTIPATGGNKVLTANISVLDKISVFDETFESYTANEAFNSTKWTVGTAPAGGFVKIIPRPTGAPANTESGQCVHIKVDNDPGSVDITANFQRLTDTAVVEFDFMYDRAGGKLVYLNGEGYNVSSFISNSITSIQMDSTYYTIMSSTSKNRWYKIKVVANIVDNTTDWYVDGVLKVSDKSFRNPTKSLSQIAFGTFTLGSNTDLYIDNVKVYDQ